MPQNQIKPGNWPDWFNGKTISEPIFCREFLRNHHLAYTENAFFTQDGKLADPNILRSQIYRLLEQHITSSVSNKIDNIMSVLRYSAQIDDLLPQTDRIHLQNGTLFLNGSFNENKNEIVRSRFPVRYNPAVSPPGRWLKFLSELFWPEDIPTIQEFLGYALIPSNAGQKMMIIKGNGGEGKSQIGNVLFHLFGQNARDGSVGKLSENRFALADLEHVHLMIDDDMRLEALKDTSRVKSVVTCKGKMDMERKGRQSHQGWMYARILTFSNGDLQSLYDRSDGFYRRQLILTTRRKPPDRVDDPRLSEKLCEEAESIFLWMFEGLQRLVSNNFRFTESERARQNRLTIRKEANNIDLFMESEGYIRRNVDCSISSKELERVYQTWCSENAYPPMKGKTLIEYLAANQEKFGVVYTNNIINDAGRRVRGIKGIGPVISLTGISTENWHRDDSDDNPF